MRPSKYRTPGFQTEADGRCTSGERLLTAAAEIVSELLLTTFKSDLPGACEQGHNDNMQQHQQRLSKWHCHMKKRQKIAPRFNITKSRQPFFADGRGTPEGLAEAFISGSTRPGGLPTTLRKPAPHDGTNPERYRSLAHALQTHQKVSSLVCTLRCVSTAAFYSTHFL